MKPRARFLAAVPVLVLALACNAILGNEASIAYVDANDAAPATADAGDADDATPDVDGASPPASAYRAAVLADGPIAYYRFEETAGNEAANEVAQDGGIPSATMLNVTLGRAGAILTDPGARAVELTGTGRVTVDDPRFTFSGMAPFTLEAWVQPSSLDNTPRRLFSHEIGSPPQGYLVAFYVNLAEFRRATDAGYVQATLYDASIAPARWTYVVATYDGRAQRLYFDAKLVALSAGPTNALGAVDTPLATGAIGSTGASTLVGLLDEVAVYDKALTTAQIEAHFAAATVR